MENRFAARVESLRDLMRSRGWDAVIITGSDPHCSEYPADRWKQVQWISGFTGEAGDIVVTMDHAGLWTDTRYFIQANQQLDGTGIVLHKTRVPEQVLIPQWLAAWSFEDEDHAPVIAVDGLCQSVDAMESICAAFRAEGKDEPELVSVPDMLGMLWKDRPEIPHTPITTLGADICGESRAERIGRVREFLEERGCGGIFITSLDDIAWLLNVRASDIEYNPYAISYLEITATDAKWFVRKDAYNADDSNTLDSFEELEEDGVQILPYDEATLTVSQDCLEYAPLFVDPSTLNWSIWSVLDKGSIVQGTSPVALWKSVKNETEIAGMREAHIADGAVMEQFLYWLEQNAGSGITEWDAAVELGRLRSGIDGYRGDSFQTISAYGKGAALPHYITPSEDAPVLERHGLYLCDSGGQYIFGTTDITRTVPLGPCTMQEKEDYTIVLKGHIGLAMAVFPYGTAGCQIDALAREPLWRAMRNFGHGTGHGVGFYLGVHEGPQDIRQNFNRQPVLPGMITSNEPGLYREGKHGIRHENLVLCVEKGSSEFGRFLEFETITMCHFDTGAVILDLLSPDERRWLNDYNSKVYETLSPLLPEDVRAWLENKCKEI